MSAAFSAGDIWATSRWRSTSVALAVARSSVGVAVTVALAPLLLQRGLDWTGGACGVTVGDPGSRWVNQLAKTWS